MFDWNKNVFEQILGYSADEWRILNNGDDIMKNTYMKNENQYMISEKVHFDEKEMDELWDEFMKELGDD